MKQNKFLEEIGLAIVKGEYSAGAALPSENHLAKLFKVSRTTVRSATKSLESKGLVEIRRASGTFVNDKFEWNWLDETVLNWALETDQRLHIQQELRRVRLMIEPDIVQLAAQNATAYDLQVMEAAIDQMRISNGDLEIFNTADISFHDAIAKACGNPILYRMGKTVLALQQPIFIETFVSDPLELEETIALHQQIFDSIRLQKSEEAKALAMTLIQRAYRNFIEIKKASPI
ncbi:fructuronate-inducible hexuronate regulon transcriptional repressor [Gammaproteobacteria bacterium]|nr:fructuronate-inducible hexuronate regulon transcriptional repressor [Gammaproteobacteria bacterium]